MKFTWPAFFRRLRKSYRDTTLATMRKRSPFRVLVSTVISQRTKDETTSKVSAALFSKYNSPENIANAPLRTLYRILKPSGFYHQKAKHIRALSKIISVELHGVVPDEMDELTKLPGVGRKTAACVMNYGFGKSAIAVDTHVHRISNRLGWVKTKRPDETEQELMKIIPKRYWVELNDLFVSHGKNTCQPRVPICSRCIIKTYCAGTEVRNHK
ncbi:MAG: endonuclease III domain-containing protein [Planctomycetota bacterium]